MPITEWLPQYRTSWLRADLTAGATVCAVLIPLALAYSVIVGVEPVVGLYSLPLALLGYAIFGGSRLLTIGPDAAVAVLSGGVVASIALTGSEHLTLTVMLALLVGALYLIFYLLKMGWVVDLIPYPVLKGLVEGIVWVTLLKQSVALLGLQNTGSSYGFFDTMVDVFMSLSQAHFLTAIVGALSILALFLVRRIMPHIPGPLVVLIGSTTAVGLLGLDQYGVSVLGKVTGGMPAFDLSESITYDQITGLLFGALAIVLLGYTKSIPALNQAAEESGDQIDPNQELLALGVSNIGSGLGGGYALAGSLTATSVGVASGARSQIANLFAGLICVFTIAFFLPLLTYLPMSSLAAIIVVALMGLSDFGYFRSLWNVSRFEFVIGMAAFAGVLILDVVPGVLIGIILALFKLAYSIHAPVTSVVARTENGSFVDLDEHPDALEIPGVLMWRQYGHLVFLNARVLSNELYNAVQTHKDIRVIILDATASAGIDSTAAGALIKTTKDLSEKGIETWVVNPRFEGWSVVAAMLKNANEDFPRVFDTLDEAIALYSQIGSANFKPEN